MLGPGGSGVSVVAAAAALTRSADASGRRAGLPIDGARDSLLITVARASAMPDLLGVLRIPGEPVAVTAEMELLHLDPLSVIEESWADFTSALTVIGGSQSPIPVVGTLAGLAPGEVITMPGLVESMLLRRIRDAATSGRWRRIVVDLSGTDPHILLRAPQVLSAGLERLWPRSTRLAEAGEKPALAQLSAALETVVRDCQDLADIVTDPHTVAAHVVVDASDRGRRALTDQLAIADLTALPLRSVHISAGEHDAPTTAVAEYARSLLGADSPPIVDEIASAGVLDRLSRIRRVGVHLPPPNGQPRGTGALAVDKVSGDGVGSVFELGWAQRLTHPDALQLGRSGDDLLVTVDGFRYPVRLPSVLRRCGVVSADWVDGRLSIRFIPDPALWPVRAGGNETGH